MIKKNALNCLFDHAISFIHIYFIQIVLLGHFETQRYSSAMQIFSTTFFIVYCVVQGFVLCRIFVAIICDAFTQTRKDDATSLDGIALEKVIGAELKRHFMELFPFKGNILKNKLIWINLF